MNMKEELKEYRKSFWKKENINGNPRWVKLTWDDEGRTGLDKLCARVRWYALQVKWFVNGVKRHRKDLAKWWRLRCKLKKANQKLLIQTEIEKEFDRQYAIMRAKQYLYEPPTAEQIAKFVKEAENAGIKFANRVQKVPPTPPSSKVDIDITTTGL